MPDYLPLFAIAQKLGVPVTEIDGVDRYWLNAALSMIEAERIVNERKR